ncbi:MAG: site-2 protease family protein [Candidatus Komeilibacteria bacterium]
MMIIIKILSILYAIIVHEVAHGYIALRQGDPTAKLDGRLTFNPIPHLDMFGSIILPGLLLLSGSPLVIGWAKPVMVNPLNFKNQRWGNTLVSLAGPAANLLSAIIFGLLLKILLGGGYLAANNYLIIFLWYLMMINIVLMVFNLIPIPPLDGSKFLFDVLPPRWDAFKLFLMRQGPIILLGILIIDSWLGLGLFAGLINWFINIFNSFLF